MWELPFWLNLVIAALLPATQTLWLNIASIPVNTKEILVLVVTGFYLLPRLKHRQLTTNAGLLKFWSLGLPLLTTLLLVYAALSTAWSGISQRDTLAMLYTLVLTFAAFCLGYMLIANVSLANLRPLLWKLTIFLALVGLLYSAQSFLGLGLRSQAIAEMSASEFGVQRVAGPLFVASTAPLILIPALAFSVQELLRSRKQLLLKIFVTSALILTTVGTGSRSALLLLAIFLMLLPFLIRGTTKRFLAVAFMLTIIATVFLTVFSQARTDRLVSTADDGRSSTYLVSWKIMENRSDVQNLFGSGYGSRWPWYLTFLDSTFDPWEYKPFGQPESVSFISISTPYGPMLAHPHSTFLLLVVELGVPGLAYFLILVLVLARTFWVCLKQPSTENEIFAYGVLVSCLHLFFDLLVFKESQINAIWWIYLFGNLALAAAAKPKLSPAPDHLPALNPQHHESPGSLPY